MKKLSQAFDFQRFQQNPRLAAIIDDVESRYAETALTDEDLELVSAAGDIDAAQETEERLPLVYTPYPNRKSREDH